jgi:hypothetical protein
MRSGRRSDPRDAGYAAIASFTVDFRFFLAYFFVTKRPVRASRYRRWKVLSGWGFVFAFFAMDCFSFLMGCLDRFQGDRLLRHGA